MAIEQQTTSGSASMRSSSAMALFIGGCAVTWFSPQQSGSRCRASAGFRPRVSMRWRMAAHWRARSSWVRSRDRCGGRAGRRRSRPCASRHVRVDVELGDDRDRGTEEVAHRGEDVAFAVVDPLGGHRPVHVEEHPVDRADLPHRGDHVAEDLVEDRPRRRAARVGAGEDRRHQLEAVLLRPGEKAADGGVAAAELVEDLPAAQVSEALVAVAVPVGLHGGEGAGFVADGSRSDSHRPSPLSGWGARFPCDHPWP